MPTILRTRAKENSTYIVTVTFYDEDGNQVPPTAVQWSLTDKSGTVINGREDVVLSPAEEVEIVLYGADLAVGTPTAAQRYLLVEASYNSSLGSNLPLNEEALFFIDGIVDIP